MLREHLALPTEQPLVFGLGLLGLAVDEALDLVELVHANDAAGVLAVAAGLAPEARRPPRVAPRSVRKIEDLAGVVAGQGHLRRADQIEIVGLEVIDLLGVCTEKTGARHDFRAHQHRRNHQGEAVLLGQPRGQLQQPEL